jgi:hypothetical protein
MGSLWVFVVPRLLRLPTLPKLTPKTYASKKCRLVVSIRLESSGGPLSYLDSSATRRSEIVYRTIPSTGR